jgi:hypothetical protein
MPQFDFLRDIERPEDVRDAPRDPISPPIATPEPTRPPAKSRDSGYQRTTVYLPKSLHRAVKAKAYRQGRELSEIVTELLERWLQDS